MVTAGAAIRKYFAKLGLAAEIADIYLALHTHGPQSISALSRNARVERTRIYRLIDTLMEANLIELEAGAARGIIKAAPITNLRLLINKREQELKNLEDELGLIEQTLARNSLSNAALRAQLYQGPHGIRRLLDNILNAKDDVIGYASRNLEAITGKKHAEQWAGECHKRQLRIRLLVNDAASLGGRLHSRTITYQAIDPKQLAITHLRVVYDDVVAHVHWQKGEVFGMEVFNQEQAAAERQLLELVWEKSYPETTV